MLKNATAANASEIEALWREAQPWLAIPKSSAGGIGLAYGDLLLRNGDLASARKAFDLFKTIEMGTRQPSRGNACEARPIARHGGLGQCA